MDGYTKVAAVGDIAPGSMKTVRVGVSAVALANVDGEFFAIGDVCSHQQCSLGSEGALDGNVVICGCHGSQFDVGTGHVMAPPATQDVPTYDVKIDGGNVWVKG
jgi:nitrite reductase/ring-hydroxylating ferredoxin subunit